MLEVILLSPQELLFTGRVHHITLPGEAGVFEVWPFHRPFVSRLLPGCIVLADDQVFTIKRGVVKVEQDVVTAIVETTTDDG